MSSFRKGLLLSIIVMIVPLLGCLHLIKPDWAFNPDENRGPLEKPRMAPDTVVLEVMFVHVASDANRLDSPTWVDMDETHLSIPMRRRLDANGIRCGLISGILPESMLELIESDRNTSDLEQRTGKVLPQSGQRVQRMQFRTGQPGRIVVSPTMHEQLSVMVVDGDYVQGTTFRQAQCLFGLRTYPQGDGRIRLELAPEIHHGKTKTQFVGQDGAWLLKADRAIERFDQLEIVHLLDPGHTLVLSSSPTPRGLGRSFFNDSLAASDTSIMVLIRLAQTQRNDLFELE